MTPDAIYDKIRDYIGRDDIICDLHSACTPLKRNTYMCVTAGSKVRVVDFDSVKVNADKEKWGSTKRKSVDAVVNSASNKYFCFVEMKSWYLHLKFNDTEEAVRDKAAEYESDLPEKFRNSIEICKQIIDEHVFDDCNLIYILLTDVSVTSDGLSNFMSNLAALSGVSSDLIKLCNKLSSNIMNGINTVGTRYWECRSFDGNIKLL